jgi:hypothetical protein
MPSGTWNDPLTISGLLDDPTQLNHLGQNPLFNMGMGLLASSYDPSVNPYTVALQGLHTARATEADDDRLQRAADQRAAIAQYFTELQDATEKKEAGNLSSLFIDQGNYQSPSQDTPYAGIPHENSLRDYVNEQVWKYQLGMME